MDSEDEMEMEGRLGIDDDFPEMDLDSYDESHRSKRLIDRAFCNLDKELVSPDCCLQKVQEIFDFINVKTNQSSLQYKMDASLHVAISNPFCSSDVIRLLLQKGARNSARNSIGKTPLHIALENNVLNFEIIQILLEHAPLRGKIPAIHMMDSKGNTPLLVALANLNCNINVLKFLVSKGADVRSENKTLQNSLDILLENPSCSLEMVKFLLDQNFPAEKIQYSSGIYLSNYNCQKEIVQELIQRELDHAANSKALEPQDASFMRKVQYQQQRLAKSKRTGIPLSLRAKQVFTYSSPNVLHFAVKNPNCYKILPELFARNGWNVNAIDPNYNTPLHLAVKLIESEEKVVSLLLNQGASVHAINLRKEYPMFCAISSPKINMKIVKLLLNAGSPVCSSSCCIKKIIERYAIAPGRFRVCVEFLVKFVIKERVRKSLTDNIFHKIIVGFICEHVNGSHYAHLSDFSRACCEELYLMKRIMLNKFLSLFSFIWKPPKKITNEKLDKVLHALCSNNFIIYRDMIADSLEKSHMIIYLSKLGFYGSHKQIGTQAAKVFLNQHCIEIIATYLPNIDLLNLISAYYMHEPDSLGSNNYKPILSGQTVSKCPRPYDFRT